MHAEGVAVPEVGRFVLRQGHELVVFGDGQDLPQRTIDIVENGLPVGIRLTGSNLYLGKWACLGFSLLKTLSI